MMYEQSNVEDFNREFGFLIGYIPCIPDKCGVERNIKLIEEELQELKDGFAANDVVEVADGLADLLYVVLGCAVSCGMDMEPLFREVHRSNMTKKGGVKDVYGKLIKPITYEPAKLLPILIRQGYKP